MNPEKRPARSAAKPFENAADKNIYSQLAHINRHDASGMIRIQNNNCAMLVRFFYDRFDVLNVCALEQDMRDWDKKSRIVNGIEYFFRWNRNAVVCFDDLHPGAK